MEASKLSAGLLAEVVIATILAVLSASTALGDGTNAFRPYRLLQPVPGRLEWSTNGHPVIIVPSTPHTDPPVRRIEASKALAITNGIKLGQVATNLGPGYASRSLGTLTIFWLFADGRVLCVRPLDCSPDEVLISSGEGYGRFWWKTNADTFLPAPSPNQHLQATPR